MDQSVFIFDFDGTIADSFDFTATFLAQQNGITHLNIKEKDALRGITMKDIAVKFGTPWWRMPALLLRGRRTMTSHLREIPVFNGMETFIEELAKRDKKLFIVSSNSTKNVHSILKYNKLDKYFMNIYGGVGLFGKAQMLRKVLRDNTVHAEDCIYIGDEPRDINGARRAGMDCIAVTWGFSSQQQLKNKNPLMLVNDPRDLVKLLK